MIPQIDPKDPRAEEKAKEVCEELGLHFGACYREPGYLGKTDDYGLWDWQTKCWGCDYSVDDMTRAVNEFLERGWELITKGSKARITAICER